MDSPAPPFMDDENLKLLLFGGKGGVGKTTAAAATALYRARMRPKRNILIVSTDPAHSLSDSLDQPIGDKITSIKGVSNLFALEMDAGRRLEDFKQQHKEVLKTIADRGTFFDEEDIANFFDLSLPGMDELVAVIEVADIIQEGRYDLVILDTAPTGHTLRLLALPELMEDWVRVLNLMLEKHRYMTSLFGRYRPDETNAFLEQMSAGLGRLRALLSDANATEFVPVTIPEAMSIEETARLLEALDELGIRARTIIVNRVTTQRECLFCQARREGQKPHLVEMERRFPSRNLVLLPLLPRQVRGMDALESYAQAMRNKEMGEWRNWEIGKRENLISPPLLPRAPALLQRPLILFGGKGGVGKTTVAAATAVYLAQRNGGKKTLIFSTDPAHSLSDSFDQEIGNRVTPIASVEGLFALEMEAADLLEELKQDYVAEINEVFDAFLGRAFDAPFDRRVMEELVSLTPPGLDELMALTKIMDLMDQGAFDRTILDLAPTGHALRFLETPGLVRRWFITFFRLVLKYQGVVRLTRVAEWLRNRSKQLRRVAKLLVDAERCQFIAVTIPEAMAVLETGRLLHRLGELSIACQWTVVNMVMQASSCRFCATIQDEQRPYLDELDAFTPNLIQIPLFPHEIRGITKLKEIAGVIYGGGDGR